MPSAKSARSANHGGHNELTRAIKLQPRRSCWHAARKLADPYGIADAKCSGIHRSDFAIQSQRDTRSMGMPSAKNALEPAPLPNAPASRYEAVIRLAEAIR